MRFRYTFEKTGSHKEFLALRDIGYFPHVKNGIFLCLWENRWADSLSKEGGSQTSLLLLLFLFVCLVGKAMLVGGEMLKL